LPTAASAAETALQLVLFEELFFMMTGLRSVSESNSGMVPLNRPRLLSVPFVSQFSVTLIM